MPTYDYRCNACEHEFELFQSMSEGVKKKCPECGKLKLERLIGTGSALIFKGSGFYETDYRSSDYTKAKEADSKAAKESTKSDDSKPKKTDDKKPAAKADKKTEAKPKKAKSAS
jgi:putative FmdB family regulatory protein